ncbi:MAG: hypothetical protein U9P72_02270 [Campylobacterota bacterium]|nr:hypothetical protein [Campylobacterota bacterium]
MTNTNYTINFTQIMEDLPALFNDIQADLEEVINDEFASNCEDTMIATFEAA